MISSLPDEILIGLEEIRLRRDRPLILATGSGRLFIDDRGRGPGRPAPRHMWRPPRIWTGRFSW
jgi:hypothetical protein